MLEYIISWIFETWYNSIIGLFIFFNILYWSAAFIGSGLFSYMRKHAKLQAVTNHHLYPGQIRREIRQSMVSILIFSIQGILIQQGLINHWLYISYELNWWVIPQIIVLFLWNEIHFYLCHALLHTPFIMRRIHWVHHHSKEPTVFSTYSFHWAEAFLLGTVIFFPMLIYPFQAVAVLSLPVMSILINTLGHCNYDFFAGMRPSHLLKFSYRHSMHHKYGKGNLGFLLPWFDYLFNTSSKKTHE